MQIGRIQYKGRRRAQFFIDGKRIVLDRLDWMEAPLIDCIRIINEFNFKPDKHTEILIAKVEDPTERLEQIQHLLRGRRCFVVGRGPSLKDFDLSKLKGEFVIALNSAVWAFPKDRPADAVLFLDKRFVRENKDKLKDFDGLIFGRHGTFYHRMDFRPNVYHYPIHDDSPQQDIRQGLFCGALSGLAGLNLAMALKAEKIYLLGYDLKHDEGETYFNSDENQSNYKRQKWTDARKKLFKKFMGFGDRIINCTPDSAIDYFPYEDINKVLKRSL